MELDKQQKQLLDKAETQTHALLDTLAALSNRDVYSVAMRKHGIELWQIVRLIDEIKGNEKGGA